MSRPHYRHAAPNLARDPSCRSIKDARRARWKKAGLCSWCGGERGNKKYLTCEKCRAASRERVAKHARRSNGDGPPADYDWDAPWRRLLEVWGKGGHG